jgi:hypothetical protein
MENLVKEWCVGRVTSEDKTMDAAYLVYATEHIEGDFYKGYFIDSEGGVHESKMITPEFKADEELKKAGHNAFLKSVNLEAYTIAYEKNSRNNARNLKILNLASYFFLALFFIVCFLSIYKN